jgi:glycosyltransferase involved in cell wall biosynthesis
VTRPEAPGGPRERLSCFVVCQDEEAQIADCLESVAWCDEIVVVDGGSRDRTPEICRRYTDRVLHNPWPGFVEQKRFGFAHTTHPWVLNLDADERVSPALRDEIVALLRHPPADVHGYEVARLVRYLGRWWYRGGWYPSYRLRLVRRARAAWGGVEPHDRVLVDGRTGRLRHPLLHYTYTDISDHLATVNRLTDAAARTRVGRPGLVSFVLRPGWRFVRFFVLGGGFREGVPGLFVAMTAAFYVFLRFAKGFERAGGTAPAPPRSGG